MALRVTPILEPLSAEALSNAPEAMRKSKRFSATRFLFNPASSRPQRAEYRNVESIEALLVDATMVSRSGWRVKTKSLTSVRQNIEYQEIWRLTDGSELWIEF